MVRGQFTFTTNNGALTIMGYTGSDVVVDVPGTTNGLPVTSIGDRAFFGAFSLASVTLPDGITNVGSYAFDYCVGLTNINIPESVISIGEDAFVDCESLTSIAIGSNVTTIGNWAFALCTSLTNITVDSANPYYSSADGVLFNQSQSTLIQCPGGKEGSYVVPGSVDTIRGYAFEACTSLNGIIIPNTVTGIGDFALHNCFSLTNISIPSSITNIGYCALVGCVRLTNIMVEPANQFYASVDGVLFDRNKTTLIQYACGKTGNYTVPSGVTSITDLAFELSIGLTNVTIPDSVTSIGLEAFEDCSSLLGVYFQGNAPSTGFFAFAGDSSVTLYRLPGTVGWGVTTALWFLPSPLILKTGPSFGLSSNGFGFIISWATNLPVVVEACTSIAHPDWFTVSTNTLNAGWSYFSDPHWTDHPAQFYRIRSP